MPSVRLEHLSFSFEKNHLFHDVTLHFEDGWTGLVGVNGAGKSTLLELLARERLPTSGGVTFEPRDARVVLCAQRVELCEPAVKAFALEAGREAHRWRAQLALSPDDVERWVALSPGERKRWQIAAALAAALAAEPDVLLLDEPLNHLDASAKASLIAALGRFRGVGVVVAHDRAFLDELTNSTVRVTHGRCEGRPGGYSAAQAEWEREETAAHSTQQVLKRQLERHSVLAARGIE